MAENAYKEWGDKGMRNGLQTTGKRILTITVIAVLCAIFCFAYSLIGSESFFRKWRAISASTEAFYQLSEEREIELGPIQADQLIIYSLSIESGIADVWIENDAGEQMPVSKFPFERGSYSCFISVDDSYSMWVSGKEATFHVSLSIYEKE